MTSKAFHYFSVNIGGTLSVSFQYCTRELSHLRGWCSIEYCSENWMFSTFNISAFSIEGYNPCLPFSPLSLPKHLSKALNPLFFNDHLILVNLSSFFWSRCFPGHLVLSFKITSLPDTQTTSPLQILSTSRWLHHVHEQPFNTPS